jgi:hypothetical protein
MALILSGDTGVPVTTVTGTLPVANGGSGVTTSTGTGAVVLGTSPTITGATITVAATAAPAFSAYANAGQSITTGVFTKVAINAELFDTNSNFDPTTNYRFTPTVEGYYQVNGTVRAVGTVNTTTQAVAALFKNGSTYVRGIDTTFSTSTIGTITCVFNEVVYMNGSTDYIELYGVLSATLPTFSFISSSITSRFSAAMVRSA